MLFKDEVGIHVKAGKGGDGSSSFHREKFVTHGGPDGGDGGDGGSVILKVNEQMRTLSHIHNHQKFKARPGGDGMKKKCFGKKGEDCVIEVPAGTVVQDAESGEILCDLTEKGQTFTVAKGGRGGKGNVHFKSSVNQSPFYAQKGRPGEERDVRLELKLIAHVGLAGFPNAGKSTLTSRITNAKPKIANYPFTTLEPNLGVMEVEGSFETLLIADIPGLIEGAHQGKGLGIEFLKHIERTSVILYLMDISDEPFEKFRLLQKELEGYSKTLFQRPHLVVLNKTDLIYEASEIQEAKKVFEEAGISVMDISAVTGKNLRELKFAIYLAYKKANEEDDHDS